MANHSHQLKKGFALQFNWIFVLLGGAVFLAFFFTLIKNLYGSNVVSESTDVTQMLDAALKVSMGSGSMERTSIFNNKLVFRCGDVSEYFVMGTLKSGRYDFNAIFAPSQLTGRTLLIKTLDFKIPFKVMPIIYVTNKEVEYVFVGNSALHLELMSLLPENATKKIIPLGTLHDYPNNNFHKTIFVVNTTNELAGAGMANFRSAKDYSRVHAVVVRPEEQGARYGDISFFSLGSLAFEPNGTSFFMGPELALGAIVANDKGIYDCNLRKVLQRIALMSELQKQRLDHYSSRSEVFCRGFYSQAALIIEGMKLEAEKDALTLEGYKSLSLAMNGLQALNTYILAEPSGVCGRIY